MFVIQFRPGGLYPFINMPMNELNDLVIDADLLFGNDIFSLREQLLNAPYPFQKFFYAEQWLLRRLTEYSFSKQVLEFAIKEICQHPTNDSIAMIAHKTGYSQRQFIHLFKKFVGLKPKYFQRIQRFNKVLEELETCKEINWTAISHDCGFYDQAHFIREFKKFSGFNPSDYLCEKGVYVNYVPVS